jgi:hypothetical protein
VVRSGLALPVNNLRQGSESCTNQQAPSLELETRMMRHSKIFPLFEIINSGSNHSPLFNGWGFYGRSWG